MIAFSFSDGGNRCENLDLFSTINCQNDMFGMVIMDGYSCSEGSMEFLSDRLGECVFSGDLDKNIIEPCKSVSVKAAVCFLLKMRRTSISIMQGIAVYIIKVGLF